LAGDERAWFFWERAGLRREDVLKVLKELAEQSERIPERRIA
jgi:hypothetical protein